MSSYYKVKHTVVTTQSTRKYFERLNKRNLQNEPVVKLLSFILFKMNSYYIFEIYKYFIFKAINR